jgi:hypothetical protein
MFARVICFSIVLLVSPLLSGTYNGDKAGKAVPVKGLCTWSKRAISCVKTAPRRIFVGSLGSGTNYGDIFWDKFTKLTGTKTHTPIGVCCPLCRGEMKCRVLGNFARSEEMLDFSLGLPNQGKEVARAL